MGYMEWGSHPEGWSAGMIVTVWLYFVRVKGVYIIPYWHFYKLYKQEPGRLPTTNSNNSAPKKYLFEAGKESEIGVTDDLPGVKFDLNTSV